MLAVDEMDNEHTQKALDSLMLIDHLAKRENFPSYNQIWS